MVCGVNCNLMVMCFCGTGSSAEASGLQHGAVCRSRVPWGLPSFCEGGSDRHAHLHRRAAAVASGVHGLLCAESLHKPLGHGGGPVAGAHRCSHRKGWEGPSLPLCLSCRLPRECGGVSACSCVGVGLGVSAASRIFTEPAIISYTHTEPAMISQTHMASFGPEIASAISKRQKW
jgi:hypothetical protein